MKNITETLGIGSLAPNFSLPAANRNDTFSLKSLLSTGPVILEFLRGTWCHNCRKRLVEINQMKYKISLSGTQVVFIAAETRDGIWKPAEYLKEHPVSFPVLLDENRAVTRAYGVYHRIALDAFDIAHPATIVVDAEQRVRYIHRGEGQSDRAPFAQALAVAETKSRAVSYLDSSIQSTSSQTNTQATPFRIRPSES